MGKWRGVIGLWPGRARIKCVRCLEISGIFTQAQARSAWIFEYFHAVKARNAWEFRAFACNKVKLDLMRHANTGRRSMHAAGLKTQELGIIRVSPRLRADAPDVRCKREGVWPTLA